MLGIPLCYIDKERNLPSEQLILYHFQQILLHRQHFSTDIFHLAVVCLHKEINIQLELMCSITNLNIAFDMVHFAYFYHNQQFLKRDMMFKIIKFSNICYVKFLLVLYLPGYFPIW
jgi:hypothetical protein